MSEAWCGAQWLLAAYLTACFTAPILVRVAGYNTKAPAEWLGWYVGRTLNLVVLILILGWGGFWK